MTAMGTPGFDGCELLTPINRFFFVEVGLCIGAVAASRGGDILVECTMWRHRGVAWLG